MKKTAAAILLALCLSGCTGELPRAREIEGMDLVRTVGVDQGAPVRVTVSTGRERQSGGTDGPALVLTQDAESISGACLAIQGQSGANLFYGHVGQLLLGEAQARQGVYAALEYVLDDIEMRLDTDFYLVAGGTAEAAISAGAEEEPAARLEAMAADGGLRSWCAPRTVGAVLEELLESGCSYAPAVVKTGDGQLEGWGYGLLRDGRLVGWADSEAARGIHLLNGAVEADLVTVETEALGTVTVRLVGGTTRIRASFDGDTFTGLSIDCRVEANLAEGGARLDQESPADTAEAAAAVEAVVRARLGAALSLCRTYEGDFFQLARRAGMAAPWRWESLEAQWDPSALVWTTSVTVEILRGYDAS